LHSNAEAFSFLRIITNLSLINNLSLTCQLSPITYINYHFLFLILKTITKHLILNTSCSYSSSTWKI